MPARKKVEGSIKRRIKNGGEKSHGGTFTISMEELIARMRIVPIEDVHLWPENPRKNDQNVDNVARSIKEHGFRSPIVVWSKNNLIYKGNTSYKAAMKLGLKSVPVSFQDFPSESSAIAYGISDNKSGEGSKWDEDILAKLMKAEDFTRDIDRTQRLTGLRQKDLNIMMGTMEAPEEFPTYNETLDTKNCCPKCGYEF